MKKFMKLYGLLLVLLLVACGSDNSNGEVSETAVAIPTQEIAAVTDTPEPTETTVPPTDTPEPTATAVPTDTPEPTETAVPPTDTPEPIDTKEPAPTDTPAKPTSTPAPDEEEAVPTAQPLTEDVEIDAMQLVLDSEARARSLQTSQFTQNVRVTLTGLEQHVTQHCMAELPDKAYCRSDITLIIGEAEPIETYNETVQQDERLWLREEGGEWQDATNEFTQSGMFSEEGLEQLVLSEFMEEAEVTGETVIDGVPVYEVTFTLDVNAYFASILGEEMAELFASGATENSGNGRSWIGQEDMLVRKAFIEMFILIEGEEMHVTTQVASFGFNEPVEIPDPTAQ